MAKTLEIIKYPNRRLYSKERSAYITQADLVREIRAGYDIRVTEKSTGNDITAEVLTQAAITVNPEHFTKDEAIKVIKAAPAANAKKAA